MSDGLREELRVLLNRHNIEATSDTPDYMLASFLLACLGAFEGTVVARDKWWGHEPWAKFRPDDEAVDP